MSVEGEWGGEAGEKVGRGGGETKVYIQYRYKHR